MSYNREWYLKNRQKKIEQTAVYRRNNPSVVTRSNHKRDLKFRDLRDKMLAYKGAFCVTCFYDKCKSALDFHHVDASKKKHVGLRSRYNLLSVDFEEIKKELDHCVVLCSNCHRELHSKEF